MVDQSEFEALCREIYQETAIFYEKIKSTLGNLALGYKILGSPPIFCPKFAFVGFQPGGNIADAMAGERVGERIGWPEQPEFLTASWPLAAGARKIWSTDHLIRSISLNCNFFRAPNRDLWDTLPVAIRNNCENFSTRQARRLIAAARPQRIIVIGLTSVREFERQPITHMSQDFSNLIVEGTLWQMPALAIKHISGARLSSEELGRLEKYFSEDDTKVKTSPAPPVSKVQTLDHLTVQDPSPQNMVLALKYLSQYGMTDSQLHSIHHSQKKRETFNAAIKYWSKTSSISSPNNVNYGERLLYIASKLSQGGNLDELIAEAKIKWPLPTG
jgi:hypothetical protein